MMHTGFISFCDRINFNIKSSDTKTDILNDLKKFNIQILEKHWYKLDEKGTEHIQKMPHLACLRSNGNPYYMYFTLYEDIPIIYYIDKKVQPGYQVPRIILTKGRWDESLFNNTLIEGEMVKDKFGGWVFLINDVIVYKNRFLSNEPLPKRLEIAFEILDKYHVSDKIIDVCDFQVKQYANATQEGTDELFELAKLLPYTSRGIYYWPFSNKYKPKLINFDDNLIKSVHRKIKDNPDFHESIPTSAPASTVVSEPLQKICADISDSDESDSEVVKKQDNSVSKPTQVEAQVSSSIPVQTSISTPTSISRDNLKENEQIYWLRKTENPDVYDMYESDNGIHKNNKIGIAQISSMQTSKMMRANFKDATVAIFIPFICSYNKTTDKWTPIRKY